MLQGGGGLTIKRGRKTTTTTVLLKMGNHDNTIAMGSGSTKITVNDGGELFYLNSQLLLGP